MASDGRMEEQKKRTLDALERRFAQAEAEVRIKKQKGKKRPREEKDRINGGVSYPPADAPVTPSSSISKKKGSFSKTNEYELIINCRRLYFAAYC